MSIADKLLTVANNTPAVCEKMDESKVKVHGAVIRVDDVLSIEHELKIQTGVIGDYASVEVYGKNLFDTRRFIDYVNSVSTGNANDTYLGESCFSFSNYRNADSSVVMPFNGQPNTRYTLSCECSFSYSNNTSYTNMAIYYIRYSDGTTESVVKTMINDSFHYVTFTTNANKTVVGIGISRFASNCTIYIKNMQIEVGAEATEYEEFKDVQIASPTYYSEVVGLKSISPTMTIVSEYANLSCKYFPTSAANVYEKYQQLKAAEIAVDKLI